MKQVQKLYRGMEIVPMYIYIYINIQKSSPLVQVAHVLTIEKKETKEILVVLLHVLTVRAACK